MLMCISGRDDDVAAEAEPGDEESEAPHHCRTTRRDDFLLCWMLLIKMLCGWKDAYDVVYCNPTANSHDANARSKSQAVAKSV